MRHLISLKEQSREDLLTILNLAQKLKAKRNAGENVDILHNKTLIMLFQKTSTRTRLSFEAAMTELGGHAIYLDGRTSQMSIGAEFIDEIKAIMRYAQILMFRALKAKDVITAASINKISVIDACSEKYHPAQILGDFLTMIEHSGGLKNFKKITYLGIENNISNSLQIACAKLGVEMSIVAPLVNEPSIDEDLNDFCQKSGLIKKTLDLEEALKNTDYVHTDTWIDMEFFKDGKVIPEFQTEYQKRLDTFMPYQVNAKMIDTYCPQAGIMHCMPCHIGYEITRDAVDHKNSYIYDQAENRLHIQKAIILWLLEKENEI